MMDTTYTIDDMSHAASSAQMHAEEAADLLTRAMKMAEEVEEAGDHEGDELEEAADEVRDGLQEAADSLHLALGEINRVL